MPPDHPRSLVEKLEEVLVHTSAFKAHSSYFELRDAVREVLDQARQEERERADLEYKFSRLLAEKADAAQSPEVAKLRMALEAEVWTDVRKSVPDLTLRRWHAEVSEMVAVLCLGNWEPQLARYTKHGWSVARVVFWRPLGPLPEPPP